MPDNEPQDKPLVPFDPPLEGMIVPKRGGLVKVGRGAINADGERTDLPVISRTLEEIRKHNNRILEEHKKK